MTFLKLNARLIGGIVIIGSIFIIIVPILVLANEEQISSEDVPQNLVRPFAFEQRSGLSFLVVAGALVLFLYLYSKKRKNVKK